MSVSDEYLIYVKDQLGHAGTVSIRRMFGGAGVYCDGLFFAIVADDVLYFKVDDSNRRDYQAAGMEPFTFSSDDKEVTLNFYEVPIDVLENRDKAVLWAQKAIRVAQSAKKIRKKNRKI